MPSLRFSRDKKGYESTFLVHAGRRDGRAVRRLLYWFRTPPNVRVGRAPLDEDAIRAIETHNPDLTFDWARILSARSSSKSAPVGRGVAAETPRGGRRGRSDLTARSNRGARGERAARRPEPDGPGPSGAPPVAMREAAPEDLDVSAEPVEDAARAAASTGAFEPPAQVPVTVYHGGADVLVPEAAAGRPVAVALVERVGSEGLARLRARYAELSARISEQTHFDEAQLAQVRQAAEELDPDTWVTPEEVTAGLDGYDDRLHAVRRALGMRRRRPRRSSQTSSRPAPSDAPENPGN